MVLIMIIKFHYFIIFHDYNLELSIEAELLLNESELTVDCCRVLGVVPSRTDQLCSDGSHRPQVQ